MKLGLATRLDEAPFVGFSPLDGAVLEGGLKDVGFLNFVLLNGFILCARPPLPCAPSARASLNCALRKRREGRQEKRTEEAVRAGDLDTRVASSREGPWEVMDKRSVQSKFRTECKAAQKLSLKCIEG